MASKRKTTKKTSVKSKAKSFYPTVLGSKLGSTTENQTSRILDVPRALSLLNRRMYRYARCYSVKIDMNINAGQTVEVYALRNDWAVQKGLQMAYQQYLKNTADERANLGKHTARWEDFRVDNGVAGASNTLLPTLHDTSLTSVILSGGEIELSGVVDATGTQKTFTWGTPGAAEYGILQEYDKSANAQRDPAVVTNDAPYVDIDSEVNEQTHDRLQTHGNDPPYDPNGVNATEPFVRIGTLGNGPAGEQRLSTGYFDAPCGIVILVGNSAGWNSDAMHFEVQRGEYKGVKAMSLLE